MEEEGVRKLAGLRVEGQDVIGTPAEWGETHTDALMMHPEMPDWIAVLHSQPPGSPETFRVVGTCTRGGWQAVITECEVNFECDADTAFTVCLGIASTAFAGIVHMTIEHNRAMARLN